LAGHSWSTGTIDMPAKPARWVVSFVICVASLWSFWHVDVLYKATKDWKKAFGYYQRGEYQASLDTYERVFPVFTREGDFLCNYGKALSVAGEHQKALIVLEE